MKLTMAVLICLAMAPLAWATPPRPQEGKACSGTAASYALTLNGDNLITAPAMSESGRTITLSRFHPLDGSLEAWRQEVGTGGPQSDRKSASVTILDKTGRKLGQIDLVAAWPSKLTATGTHVGSGSAADLIESVTLTFASVRKTCT